MVDVSVLIAALALACLFELHAENTLGNSLCWRLGGRTYERCCAPIGAEITRGAEEPETQGIIAGCWEGLWYTADFCCHPLPETYLQRYLAIEGRLVALLDKLQSVADEFHHGKIVEESEQIGGYLKWRIREYSLLLESPPTLWGFACSSPDSPLLWNDGCACCDPLVASLVGQECPASAASAIREEFAQSCFPVYARKGSEPPDEALQASIRSHLRSVRISRNVLLTRGPRMGIAQGCALTISGVEVESCDDRACEHVDCTYLRALLLIVSVIQQLRPLPDMELVVDTGTLDPLSANDPDVAVFMFTGTKWTNTISLPAEWQLHPTQCGQQVKLGTYIYQTTPWEERIPKLIWRGSASNGQVPGCRTREAASSKEAMKFCGVLPDGMVLRDSTWNHSTWLSMQRGRLVWMSSFDPTIDAKLTLLKNGVNHLEPSLQDFLQSQGIIADSMPAEEQGRYKYMIAAEGHVAADRLFWQLFTGSVVLIPEGPWKMYAAVDMLKPYVHYVPVRYDLSDLPDLVQWLRRHDGRARRIAQNGLAFAQRYFTCEGVVHYVDQLLRAYADITSE